MADLMLHSPKFASKLVTLDALRAMPDPIAMGPRHKPVPHAVLVDGLLSEIDRRGYDVIRTQFALGAKGSALFGIINIAGGIDGRAMAFGLRNSVNQSLGLSGVAGNTVFVCDNLSFSGDTFAFERKNTTGLDLGSMIANGFDKFLAYSQAFEARIGKLAGTVLSDDRAKSIIVDVFRAHALPVRLFDDVTRFYFDAPAETVPEIADNRGNAWGLFNAFTRAAKDLSPVRLFGASVNLGRLLLPSNVVDVEPVVTFDDVDE